MESLGWIQTVLLVGCKVVFISLTNCKLHKHTVGANDVEDTAEEEKGRRLVKSVRGSWHLSRGSVGLSESQRTA